MSDLLSGRTAVVSGAAQGIGLAIASAFLDHGAAVALVDVQEGKLRETVGRLTAERRQAVAVQADITDEAAVEAMVASVIDELGPIDILVNNAGGSAGAGRIADIEELPLSVWNEVVALNLTSTFLCCRAVVAGMRARGFGRIINIASSLAWGGWGAHLGTVQAGLPYVASKAAVVGLTAQLGKELAASGICVNALAPGLVLGEPGSTIRDRFDAMSETTRARAVSRFPIGRPGEPREVAWLAVALAADEASYISGETVLVAAAAGGA